MSKNANIVLFDCASVDLEHRSVRHTRGESPDPTSCGCPACSSHSAGHLLFPVLTREAQALRPSQRQAKGRERVCCFPLLFLSLSLLITKLLTKAWSTCRRLSYSGILKTLGESPGLRPACPHPAALPPAPGVSPEVATTRQPGHARAEPVSTCTRLALTAGRQHALVTLAVLPLHQTVRAEPSFLSWNCTT